MALNRLKDGSFRSLTSESDVAAALKRRDEIEELLDEANAELAELELVKFIDELREEDGALIGAVDSYVLANYKPSEGFENSAWKATKVQGTKKWWDADILARLVPRGIYKGLVKIEVDAGKIDEAVRSGKIKLDDIEGALQTEKQKPYVKMTRRNESNGGNEADSLLAKLSK